MIDGKFIFHIYIEIELLGIGVISGFLEKGSPSWWPLDSITMQMRMMIVTSTLSCMLLSQSNMRPTDYYIKQGFRFCRSALFGLWLIGIGHYYLAIVILFLSLVMCIESTRTLDMTLKIFLEAYRARLKLGWFFLWAADRWKYLIKYIF